MKYLFWNCNKKDGKIITEHLINIVKTYKPNIIALAEYSDDTSELVKSLNNSGSTNTKYFAQGRISCTRIHIISHFEIFSDSIIADNTYYDLRLFPYVKKTGEKHLVAFIHLPSKLYDDDGKNQMIIEKLNQEIRKAKEKLNVNKVLILGDFNMNPFEKLMVSFQGFHAISSKLKIEKSKSRKICDVRNEFFYNPFWSFMGDRFLPVGSYYYENSNSTCYFWNCFDQFIVNSYLMNDVNFEQIKYIEEIENEKLFRNQLGVPDKNISDHFPLYFELRGE